LSFAPRFVPLLLAVLGFAVFVNCSCVWYFRGEYRETHKAFRDTDCEFSSIFHSALGGILILDNDARWLDGNPAAAHILRVDRTRIVGANIGTFFIDTAAFELKWRAFLQSKNHRGSAHLQAGDGTTVIVDLAGAADYLPGRHIFIFTDVT